MVALQGKTRYKTISLVVALFLLALILRLWALDVFMTPDEYRWVGRSATFLYELVTLSPKVAYADGFPGVTTRWAGTAGLLWNYGTGNYGEKTFLESGSPGLLEFLTALRSTDFSLLPPTRVPIALTTAVCIVVLYLLIRRLFGDLPALVAGLLLALEPFLVGLSRVLHHDALVSSFIGIAVLSLLIYLGEERPRVGFLVLSGVTTGLALLSKATATFLLPYAAFVTAIACVRWEGLIPHLDRRRILRALASLVAWGLLAAVVVVALWPVMWVDPLGTLNELFGRTTHFASTPHQPGNYFLGQPVPDPGPLFYWVAFLFRTTPLTWLGLLASLFLFRAQRRSRLHLFALWSFVILFLVFMSLGTKKLDRYSLPAILLADVLAGAGLTYLLNVLQRGLQRWGQLSVDRARRLAVGLGLTAIALVCGILLWPNVPYYLTYYNPLLGGNQGAAAAIMVGWGEGCDLAAHYLNQKDNAADLDVAAWYDGPCFGPLFDGTAWDIRTEDLNQQVGLPWYAMDYVVTYINQVQRETPTKEATDFFQSLEPEYVARIAGFEYAWVYRVPETIPDSVLPTARCSVHKVPSGNFDNRVWLKNYAIGDTAFREKASFAAGETVLLALRWRTERPLGSHYKVFAHVYDSQGRLVTQADDWLGSIYMEHELRTRSSSKIMNYMACTIPPATPPGDYTVAVGLYDEATGRRLGALNEAGQATGTTVALTTLSVVRPATPQAIANLTIQHPFPAGIELPEGLTLLGYDLQPSEGKAGERLSVALYWQAQRDNLADLLVALQLRDAAGQVWGYHASPPVDGLYPTTSWIAGEIVRDVHDLNVEAAVSPGELRLVLLVGGQATPLGTVPIVGRQHAFDEPTVSHPQPVDLAGARFLGYDLSVTTVQPGQPVPLTLYWECLDKLETPYKLFIHLVDDQYGIWGQVDRVPCDGECPTTSWLPGEYLTGVYQLVPKPDTPPGTYRIAIGLYDEHTGTRLLRADGTGDHILLDATITVQGQ